MRRLTALRHLPLALALAVAAPAIHAAEFQPDSVAVSATAMPAFPFLTVPASVGSGYPDSTIDFDRAYVIAGDRLRAVEGAVWERSFPASVLKTPATELLQSWSHIIKGWGGVKINTALPEDPSFLALNKLDRDAVTKKLRQFGGVQAFDQYLIRRANGNVWIAVALVSDGLNVRAVVVEERALVQHVGPFKASTVK